MTDWDDWKKALIAAAAVEAGKEGVKYAWRNRDKVLGGPADVPDVIFMEALYTNPQQGCMSRSEFAPVRAIIQDTEYLHLVEEQMDSWLWGGFIQACPDEELTKKLNLIESSSKDLYKFVVIECFCWLESVWSRKQFAELIKRDSVKSLQGRFKKTMSLLKRSSSEAEISRLKNNLFSELNILSEITHREWVAIALVDYLYQKQKEAPSQDNSDQSAIQSQAKKILKDPRLDEVSLEEAEEFFLKRVRDAQQSSYLTSSALSEETPEEVLKWASASGLNFDHVDDDAWAQVAQDFKQKMKISERQRGALGNMIFQIL